MVSGQDSIVLIEDGVYGALEQTEFSELVKKTLQKAAVYALLPDLMARGIEKRIIAGIQTIDYAGFVTLTEKHSVVQSWF